MQYEILAFTANFIISTNTATNYSVAPLEYFTINSTSWRLYVIVKCKKF